MNEISRSSFSSHHPLLFAQVASVAPAQCHLPHLRSPTLCPETTSMLIQFLDGKNHEKTMGLTVKFSTDFLLDKISPWNFLIGSVMDAGLDFGLWSSIGKHTCVLSLAYQQLFHLRSPLWRIWSCVGGSWSRPIINSSKKLRSSASFRCDQVTDLTPQLVQYLIMYRIRKIQNSEYKQISCKYQANIKDNFK